MNSKHSTQLYAKHIHLHACQIQVTGHVYPVPVHWQSLTNKILILQISSFSSFVCPRLSTNGLIGVGRSIHDVTGMLAQTQRISTLLLWKYVFRWSLLMLFHTFVVNMPFLQCTMAYFILAQHCSRSINVYCSENWPHLYDKHLFTCVSLCQIWVHLSCGHNKQRGVLTPAAPLYSLLSQWKCGRAWIWRRLLRLAHFKTTKYVTLVSGYLPVRGLLIK